MFKNAKVPPPSEVAVLYRYRVLVQANQSQIEAVEGVDPRPPAQVRDAWIAASRATTERNRLNDHRRVLANMQNNALGKKIEDGLEQAELNDVKAPPEDCGDESEQLVLAGRPDGGGYFSVVAGLVVGIACDGVADLGPLDTWKRTERP